MRLLGEHPINNTSGGLWALSLVGWAINQWLPQLFSELHLNVPWLWIAAVCFAFWSGGQLNQVEEGTHRLHAWWRNRARFVIPTLRKQWDLPHYAFYADLKFTRHAENVVVRLDSYRRMIKGWGGSGYVWEREFTATPINRAACNKGHGESVRLCQLRKDPATASSGGSRDSVWKIELTVTAAGREASVTEFYFWALEVGLFELPALPPVAENDGDSREFRSEGEVVWTIE